MFNKYFKGLDRKKVISWSLYDFANSAYTILILSFVFPIYFKEVIVNNAAADFYWGLIVSISILIGGIIAPVIGAVADYDNRRKSKFIIFVLIAVIGTAALYFTGQGTLLLASLIFIFANIFVELAQAIYDSFLPEISKRKNSGKVSGLGWGLGYLGGIVAMLALRPLYVNGYSDDILYRLVFPLTALFFLIFSIPIFINLKDKKIKKTKVNIWKKTVQGFKDVLTTLKQIRRYKNVGLFLIAFYFMNDALVTVFTFLPIYARSTLLLSFTQIMIGAVLGQVIGFIATIIFGSLSDRVGSKKLVLAAIGVWIASIVILYFSFSATLFYVVAVLSGLAIGSSQAIARSWLSRIIPYAKRSQFFGFNAFASKIAATTGPLLFGAISFVTGNQRLALLSIIALFLISFILFLFVKER